MTDCLDQRADALRCLGDVLEHDGRDGDESLRKALEFYDEKGNVVLSSRVRERLGSGGRLEGGRT